MNKTTPKIGRRHTTQTMPDFQPQFTIDCLVGAMRPRQIVVTLHFEQPTDSALELKIQLAR